MLQRRLDRVRRANDREKGFTSIELLVVIVFIGILAAIALPTFLRQLDKSKDSAARSDVRRAVAQVESCLADGATPARCTTKATNPSIGRFPLLTKAAADGAGYSLTATSQAGPDHTYTISKSARAPGGFFFTAGTDATGRDAWAANSWTASRP